MNAFSAGQALLRSWWGGQPSPAAVAARPNFTLDDVTLVTREGKKKKKATAFEGLTAVFPRGRNVALFVDTAFAAESLVRLLTGMERPTSGRITRAARMSWPMTFAGYLLTDCSMRENTLFLARLYGENGPQTANFVRDLMEIGAEFDQKLTEITAAEKKKFAASLALAIDFDCYILDGVMQMRDDDFVDRWERVLEARLRTADVIQITTRRRGLLRSHEIGAILRGSSMQFYPTVEAALGEFVESGEDMVDIEVADALAAPSEGEGESFL